MNSASLPISPYSVELSRHDLRTMIKVVKLLHKLSQNSDYHAVLNAEFPPTRADNPQNSAVMMGYDFHLSASGAKLIEVNTNAGGLWFAQLSYQPNARTFSPQLTQKLLNSFNNEYALFSNTAKKSLNSLIILDENPQQQFLYPEMRIFAEMFTQAGIQIQILAPEDLSYQPDGVYFQQQRIEMIYNRHCDFYLQTPALQSLRQAWLQKHVCLSPNPAVYKLLADKQRMMMWSNPELLAGFGLSAADIAFLQHTILPTVSLAELSPEHAWQSRKQWVFKPNSGYGSRGVYVGDKLTKSKFAELNPQQTLLQHYSAPSITRINEALQFKTDFRLFVYQTRVLAVSARLYQGQVTNLRTPAGGFAKVCLSK